jgi:hypothetical protein
MKQILAQGSGNIEALADPFESSNVPEAMVPWMRQQASAAIRQAEKGS